MTLIWCEAGVPALFPLERDPVKRGGGGGVGESRKRKWCTAAGHTCATCGEQVHWDRAAAAGVGGSHGSPIASETHIVPVIVYVWEDCVLRRDLDRKWTHRKCRIRDNLSGCGTGSRRSRLFVVCMRMGGRRRFGSDRPLAGRCARESRSSWMPVRKGQEKQ